MTKQPLSDVRKISPSTEHPLYWALHDLCGVRAHEIKRLGRLSTSRLERLRRGYAVPQDVADRLLSVLEQAMDQMALDAPPRADVPEVIRNYRAALFTVGRQILSDFRPRPKGPTPDTDLARSVLTLVGRGPTPRAYVVGALSRVHSARAVRRCGERMGMVESVDAQGRLVWTPPPGAPRPVFPLPPPARSVAPPGTRRAETQDALVLALGRTPLEEGRLARDVVGELVLRGFSRLGVYRAARDMQLRRLTTGFGPEKRVRWFLPVVEERPDPPDDSPSKVVKVDFRRRSP